MMRHQLRSAWLVGGLLIVGACGNTERGAGRNGSLDRLVAELLPAAERLSGMASTGPVVVELTSPDRVRAYVESRLDLYLPGDQLDGMKRSYALFGLLPDSLDLRALLLELYREQVAGYYDPEARKLFVVDAPATGPLEPVLVHELVHAIQDQHVDLDSLIRQRGRNDRQTAAQAAIEGHATLVMYGWLAESATGRPADPATLPDPGAGVADMLAGADQFPVFRRAPRIIRETLIFPYAAGASFVHALWTSDSSHPPPFGDRLPASTEQVLEPRARFLAVRDDPVEVRHEAVSGWDVTYENTLGELETSILLQEIAGAGPDGARGWDGDRYTLYGSAGGPVLVWTSIWDDQASADRFVATLARVAQGSSQRALDVLPVDVAGRPGVRVTFSGAGLGAPQPGVYCVDADDARIPCDEAFAG